MRPPTQCTSLPWARWAGCCHRTTPGRPKCAFRLPEAHFLPKSQSGAFCSPYTESIAQGQTDKRSPLRASLDTLPNRKRPQPRNGWANSWSRPPPRSRHQPDGKGSRQTLKAHLTALPGWCVRFPRSTSAFWSGHCSHPLRAVQTLRHPRALLVEQDHRPGPSSLNPRPGPSRPAWDWVEEPWGQADREF